MRPQVCGTQFPQFELNLNSDVQPMVLPTLSLGPPLPDAVSAFNAPNTVKVGEA